ncbi:MAG TPA: hypothetical protein LFW21_01120 [Rickettsia endosymbiont of Pyrocoelia pectoralis]|nr:hypothetical protein [Rickettsia endosymbiont of Pyrocoelia pectoralis]
MKENTDSSSSSDSDNEDFHNFDLQEDIKEYYRQGQDSFNKGYYKKAIKRFEKAKLIDEDESYIYDFNYCIGLSYSKLAENEKDVAQKKHFYEMVITFLLPVKQDYLDYKKDDDETDDRFKDLYDTLGKAYDKVGRNKEAVICYKKNPTVRRIEEIEKEQEFNKVNTKSVDQSHNCNQVFPNSNIINAPNLGISSQNFSPNFKIPNSISMDDIQDIIQYFGQEISNLKQQVNILAEVCHYAGVMKMGSINKTVEMLQRKYPDLYKYYNEFKHTLKATMDTCEIISSGLIVPDAEHIQSKSGVASVRTLCYLFDIIAVGRFGSLLTFLHDVGDNSYNTRSENSLLKELDGLFSILKSKFNNSYFKEIEIQQIALYFTLLQQQIILNIEAINPQDNAANSLKDTINKKFVAFKQAMYKYFEGSKTQKETDAISKLAFQDVGALLSYLYDNHESIKSNEAPLAQQIEQVATSGVLSRLWLDKINSSMIGGNMLPPPVECGMLRVQKNLDIKLTFDKIKNGNWDNITRSFINFKWGEIDLTSIFIPITISVPIGLEGSKSGKERGVEEFITEEYYKEQCKEKGVECSNEDIENFKLFMFQALCSRETFNDPKEEEKTELLIRYYVTKYSEITKLVLEKAPHFFRKQKWAEKFLNEQDQTKVIAAINADNKLNQNIEVAIWTWDAHKTDTKALGDVEVH